MTAPCSSHRSGSAGAEPGVHRPRWEVADVFRRYGEAYRCAHRLPLSHLQVMHAIEVCRTESLGGHVERCDVCGFERHAYNSCRNRHCPKCQALAKAAWLEARKADLLDVGYFHVVFTLPHELNPVALWNKKIVYDLLFRTVADTLQTFGADPRNGLGGKLGFTAVLHTWDQQLRQHVHLHCLVPGGVLAPDRASWIHARRGFLFPVQALAKVFRGKFIAALKQAFADEKLQFSGAAAPLGTPDGFDQLIRRLWNKPWIVYAKRPFAGPTTVLDYLGRYTHRVAISNHRIIRIHDGAVSFSYRDRSDENRKKTCTLAASEFIRRFLLHVLPTGYVRIRHFGLLSSRAKGKDLPRCRQLLGMAPQPPGADARAARQALLERLGLDLSTCPHCRRGTFRCVALLPPTHRELAQRPAAHLPKPDT